MQCSIDGCSGLVLARDWCRKHYLRWYKHGDPETKLNRWGEDQNSDTKRCSKCGKDLPVDQFYKRTESSKPMYKCKRCCRRPKDVAHQQNIKRRYKLGIEDYNNLLAKQEGRCAICKSEPGDRNLSVDHDHVTGRVRGLLCYSCNTGIGMFYDDISRLRSAIVYLKYYDYSEELASTCFRER